MKEEETKMFGQAGLEDGGQETMTEAAASDLPGKEAEDASDSDGCREPDAFSDIEDSKTTENPGDVAECGAQAEPVPDAPNTSDEGKETAELAEKLLAVTEELKRSTEAQRDLERKVIQTLKENANFQIQVRQNMQKELEEAKKKLSGDIFVPLLKDIAELYIEWQDVLNDLEPGVAKNKVTSIFDILRDILEENGCEFGSSDIDTKRRPKYSQLKNKVPTGEKERHETIAGSHNPWIVKEPFVLYPEKVDVYVYDEKLALASEQPGKELPSGQE